MSKLLLIHPFLLWSIIGLVLGLALLHPALWPLIFVGMGLLHYVVENLATAKGALWAGLSIGTIKSAVVLVWFFAAYPLDWIGLASGHWQLVVIAAYWLPAAFVLGIGTAGFVYVYVKYVRRFPSYQALLLGGLLFVMMEVVGALIFAICASGPGSSIQAHFSFGHVGYALALHPILLQLAAIGSVYILSFAVYVVSGLLYRYRTHTKYVLVSMVLLIASSYFPVPLPVTSQMQSVAILTTWWPAVDETFSQAEHDTVRSASLMAALKAAAESDASYVVLPEDAKLTAYLGGQVPTMQYSQDTFNRDVVIVDSSRTESPTQTTLRAYIYDTSNDSVYEFDKQYLVPQGEYVPYLYSGLLYSTGMVRDDGLHTKFSYRPGSIQTAVNMPAHIPSVLFCFESVAPAGVRAITRTPAPPFIAHLVSHAWFHNGSQLLEYQLDNMLQIQAVFNRTTIVQSANHARSKVYRPNGHIIYPNSIASGQYWELAVIKI